MIGRINGLSILLLNDFFGIGLKENLKVVFIKKILGKIIDNY